MSRNTEVDIEEFDDDEVVGEDGTRKSTTITIQLSENYMFKYDKYKNKWIEQLVEVKNKNPRSDKFGESRFVWQKIAGYMPTFELLCEDFILKKSARTEAKNVKEVLKTMAEAEKEVRQIAKELGKNIDVLRKADYDK